MKKYFCVLLLAISICFSACDYGDGSDGAYLNDGSDKFDYYDGTENKSFVDQRVPELAINRKKDEIISIGKGSIVLEDTNIHNSYNDRNYLVSFIEVNEFGANVGKKWISSYIKKEKDETILNYDFATYTKEVLHETMYVGKYYKIRIKLADVEDTKIIKIEKPTMEIYCTNEEYRGTTRYVNLDSTYMLLYDSRPPFPLSLFMSSYKYSYFLEIGECNKKGEIIGNCIKFDDCWTFGVETLAIRGYLTLFGIDLRKYYKNKGFDFEVGKLYRIKLAIMDEGEYWHEDTEVIGISGGHGLMDVKNVACEINKGHELVVKGDLKNVKSVDIEVTTEWRRNVSKWYNFGKNKFDRFVPTDENKRLVIDKTVSGLEDGDEITICELIDLHEWCTVYGSCEANGLGDDYGEEYPYKFFFNLTFHGYDGSTIYHTEFHKWDTIWFNNIKWHLSSYSTVSVPEGVLELSDVSDVSAFEVDPEKSVPADEGFNQNEIDPGDAYVDHAIIELYKDDYTCEDLENGLVIPIGALSEYKGLEKIWYYEVIVQLENHQYKDQELIMMWLDTGAERLISKEVDYRTSNDRSLYRYAIGCSWADAEFYEYLDRNNYLYSDSYGTHMPPHIESWMIAGMGKGDAVKQIGNLGETAPKNIYLHIDSFLDCAKNEKVSVTLRIVGSAYEDIVVNGLKSGSIIPKMANISNTDFNICAPRHTWMTGGVMNVEVGQELPVYIQSNIKTQSIKFYYGFDSRGSDVVDDGRYELAKLYNYPTIDLNLKIPRPSADFKVDDGNYALYAEILYPDGSSKVEKLNNFYLADKSTGKSDDLQFDSLSTVGGYESLILNNYKRGDYVPVYVQIIPPVNNDNNALSCKLASIYVLKMGDDMTLPESWKFIGQINPKEDTPLKSNGYHDLYKIEWQPEGPGRFMYVAESNWIYSSWHKYGGMGFEYPHYNFLGVLEYGKK